MTRTRPAGIRTSRTLRSVAGAAVLVLAALSGTLVYQTFSRPSASALLSTDSPAAPGAQTTTGANGALPDGVSVFDDRYAGIANLTPALLEALRDAAVSASEDGVHFTVNSGWRSHEYQDQLLREAISQYGSQDEASRWVATSDTSSHVSGDAVDIGPTDATAWLSEHGAAYGLCQIYANEPWHYELRPDAKHHGCPPSYPDPTHDPRMQQ